MNTSALNSSILSRVRRILLRSSAVALVFILGLAMNPAAEARRQTARTVGQAQQSARSYEAIEPEIISEMKSLIELKQEIATNKAKAAELDRLVTEAKNSGNVLNRLFLPGRMEELHSVLAKITALESEATRRQARINALYDEAEAAVENSGREVETMPRLNMVSGRELERLGAELSEQRAKLGEADTRERPAIEREIERLTALEAKARSEFNSFYGSQP